MGRLSQTVPGAADTYSKRFRKEQIDQIDSLVRDFARGPLNNDEAIRRRSSVIAGTNLTIEKIRDIAQARHEAGLYKDTLDAIPENLLRTSVRTNLYHIGVEI